MKGIQDTVDGPSTQAGSPGGHNIVKQKNAESGATFNQSLGVNEIRLTQNRYVIKLG